MPNLEYQEIDTSNGQWVGASCQSVKCTTADLKRDTGSSVSKFV